MAEGIARGLETLSRTAEATEQPVSETLWPASSFEEIFLEHYGRIVAALHRLLGDRSRAEELASEVFWKLYRRPLPPRQDGNIGGWLYRAAMNLGIDALRAAARRKEYELQAGRIQAETQSPPTPLDQVLREERSKQVRATLARMKPAQAQILLLRSTGLSYQELAAALGLALGSVGTLLNRAEIEFQKKYQQRYGREEEL
ncbi:MAG: sigma-70 family RNA polymerase sigma factor [Terriglobia bacterium]